MIFGPSILSFCLILSGIDSACNNLPFLLPPYSLVIAFISSLVRLRTSLWYWACMIAFPLLECSIPRAWPNSCRATEKNDKPENTQRQQFKHLWLKWFVYIQYALLWIIRCQLDLVFSLSLFGDLVHSSDISPRWTHQKLIPVADPDLDRRGCKSQAWPVNAVSWYIILW